MPETFLARFPVSVKPLFLTREWIEVFPMSTTSASATIQSLRFLFATHGLPVELVTDNGPQFVAREMKNFLKSNGVHHILCSPYHPASNGEAERAVRTFKESMKTMKTEPGSLSEQLGYRTTPHTATSCTPAELLMGRRIRIRLDLLYPSLSARISEKSRLVDHSCSSTNFGNRRTGHGSRLSES